MTDELNGFASKADIIYQVIYQRIKDGELHPGERLVEQNLADELGTSKTPVREALHKLKEQGLVKVEPYRGVHVAEFSIDSLLETMEIRAVLEGLAARKAAEAASEEELQKLESLVEKMVQVARKQKLQKWVELNWEFHGVIAQSCGNSELLQLLLSLRQKMVISSALGVAQDIDQSVAEHKCMLEALKARDPDSAERQARWHIEATKRRVSLLKDVPASEQGLGANTKRWVNLE